MDDLHIEFNTAAEDSMWTATRKALNAGVSFFSGKIIEQMMKIQSQINQVEIFEHHIVYKSFTINAQGELEVRVQLSK